ncbi:MAG: 5-formyltetrahydrofolate cyclo-ligase [Clostridium sp.]|nr:5-formyltetrahydrofolate cyclo-ligase [Clostridium sp.]
MSITAYDKKILRRHMLEKRKQLTEEEVRVRSAQIAGHLMRHMMYKECMHICIYQAFRNEVSCDEIKALAFADKKAVYVPVTDIAKKTMEFYRITANTDWKPGAYGIMEPVIHADTPVLEEAALILMPGLAFDREKHRLGYGGGYYDRYLNLHRHHKTAALGYRFQLTDEQLPVEHHDIIPDYIVTEDGIL